MYHSAALEYRFLKNMFQYRYIRVTIMIFFLGLSTEVFYIIHTVHVLQSIYPQQVPLMYNT